jgi:hypothetical protein
MNKEPINPKNVKMGDFSYIKRKISLYLPDISFFLNITENSSLILLSLFESRVRYRQKYLLDQAGQTK